MDLSVAPAGLLAYCAVMMVLAAIPSLSVVTVTARAATAGFVQGAWVSAGVVTGDLVFIAVALIGLV